MEGPFRWAGLNCGRDGPTFRLSCAAECVHAEPEDGEAVRQGGQKARIAGIETATTMISRGSPGRQ